jgi:hypothetical protein
VRIAALPAAAYWIVAQAFALGLELAFLVVPGNAIFLSAYGAASLPYVYMLVAVLGAGVSYSLTELQARLGLSQLAIASTLTVASLTFATWALLAFAGADWAAGGALILFALQIQLGFVFVGAQAGRAFDLQTLKRVFSWIVAAFVGGFMTGGFLSARLVEAGWAAVNLIGLSAVLAAVIAGLMIGAARHLPEPVSEPVRGGDAASEKPPSLRQVLAVPLIGAVFVYQVLSAMVTQLVEYMLYDRAAVRYPGEEELARFLGQFTAILNLVDLIVLIALGGFLMARFGLRYGLGVNPTAVGLLMGAALLIAAVAGPAHVAFFGVMALARITDVTTLDAAGRTSINATFKALPPRQRLAAQVGVEAAGVPVALGLTAILILAINAVPGTGVVHVAVATLVLTLVWCGVTVLVYRRYQAAVVGSARRRFLDGDAMDLTEPTTRGALLDMMKAGDPRDVAIAVSLLGDDPELTAHLRAAADHPSLEVQRAVARHIAGRDPALARTVAERLVRSPDPAQAADGIRLHARLGVAAGRGTIEPFLDHADTGLRAAALGALLREGGSASDAARRALDAAGSADPAERTFAARAIAEAGTTPSPEVIEALLGDRDAKVRAAAEAAAAALNDEHRIACLERPMGPRERTRFLRACRSGASPAFCAKLAAMLGRDGAETAEMVRLLLAAGWRAESADRATVDRLIDREIDRIATASRWLDAVATTDPALAPSVLRVRRALAQEAATSGRQLIDLLGLVYDRQLIGRVGRVLQGTTTGDAGISIESLDLMLEPRHRGRVIRALGLAFAPDVAATTGRGARDLAQALRDLSTGCDWAIRPDWLLASVLAAMEAAGAARTSGRIVPAGPISAELLARAAS